VLVAGHGSYALAGQDAALSPIYVLVAEHGTYTIGGQDAALAPAAILSAEHGAYTLSGQDAGLVASAVLVAGHGAYTLSGQAAALVASAVLVAGHGLYVVSGQSAAISVPGAHVPGTVYIVLAGQPETELRAKSETSLRLWSRLEHEESTAMIDGLEVSSRVAGDKLLPIAAQLVIDGAPYDLTGLSVVQFKMVKASDNSTTVDWANGSFVDRTAGRVSYTFTGSQTDTAGLYWCWFRVGDGSSVVTFPAVDPDDDAATTKARGWRLQINSTT
jgi:hypothetical protein